MTHQSTYDTAVGHVSPVLTNMVRTVMQSWIIHGYYEQLHFLECEYGI